MGAHAHPNAVRRNGDSDPVFDGFEPPPETLYSEALKLDELARGLIAQVTKFRERLAHEMVDLAAAGVSIAATPAQRKAHPIKAALTRFDQLHRGKFKDPVTQEPIPANIDGAKDSSLMKKLIERYGEERNNGLMEMFFKCDDEFVVQAGYTVGIYYSKVPGLISRSSMATRTHGVTRNTAENHRQAQVGAELIRRNYSEPQR
jgi:hypothetical protein